MDHVRTNLFLNTFPKDFIPIDWGTFIYKEEPFPRVLSIWYLNCIQPKKVQRLLLREAVKRARINEYDILEKARIIINVWAIGRDPRHWKEQEKFYPDRFLEEYRPTDYNWMLTDFKIIPFGAGRRSCPGQSFGMAIVKLVLANLLYHFDWKLPAGMKPDRTFWHRSEKKTQLVPDWLIPVAYVPVH